MIKCVLKEFFVCDFIIYFLGGGETSVSRPVLPGDNLCCVSVIVIPANGTLTRRSSVIDGGTLREGGGRGLEEKERLRYYDIDEKTTVHQDHC